MIRLTVITRAIRDIPMLDLVRSIRQVVRASIALPPVVNQAGAP